MDEENVKVSRDVEDVGTPESISLHSNDYKHRAWTDYSLAELGQWIALLAKRSSHRSNLKKRAKDLHDARNYLNMLESQVSHLEDLLYDVMKDDAFEPEE